MLKKLSLKYLVFCFVLFLLVFIGLNCVFAINYPKLYLIVPKEKIDKNFEEILNVINFNEKIFEQKNQFYNNFIENLNFCLATSILETIHNSSDPNWIDDNKDLKKFNEIVNSFDFILEDKWVKELKDFLKKFDLEMENIVNNAFNKCKIMYIQDYSSIYNTITDKTDLENKKSKYYDEFLTPSEKKRDEKEKLFLFLVRKYNFIENNKKINEEKMDNVYSLIKKLKYDLHGSNFLHDQDFTKLIYSYLENVDEIDKICKDLYYSKYYSECVLNERRYLYEIGAKIIDFYSNKIWELYSRITTSTYYKEEKEENKLNIKILYDEISINVFSFNYNLDYLNFIKNLNNNFKNLYIVFDKKVNLIENDEYKFNINGLIKLLNKLKDNIEESEKNINKRIKNEVKEKIDNFKSNLFKCIEDVEELKFSFDKIEKIKECIAIKDYFLNFVNDIPKDYINNNEFFLNEEKFFNHKIEELNEKLLIYKEELNNDLNKVYNEFDKLVKKILLSKHPFCVIESISVVERKNFKKDNSYYIIAIYKSRMRGAILGKNFYDEKIKIIGWVKSNGEVGIDYQFIN